MRREPTLDGSTGRPELSVVVPLFEEAPTVATLVDRLGAVLDALNVPAEVILVDDGSTDGTWTEIQRAHRRDGRFAGLALSRNFGHQVAISAGLRQARGAAVVVMDGDLQDPPEAIGPLLDRLNQGFDVVYAVRASRPESLAKRLAYRIFYRLLGRSASISIPLDAGDFSIMTRRVVRLLNAMPERRRFVRGLRAWVGLRQVGLPVDRGERHAGAPKFTLRKLLGLALDGLIGFNDAPLRWAGGLGALALMATILAGLLGLAVTLSGRGSVPGWALTAGVALGLGGVQLICVAILGESLVRVAQQVNGRPLYVVSRQVGLRRKGSTTPLWSRRRRVA